MGKSQLTRAEQLFPTLKTMNKRQLELMLLEIRNRDWSRIGNAMILKYDYIYYLLLQRLKEKSKQDETLNGNRWSDCISESAAKKSSESLIGCINCIDCRDCRWCNGCCWCSDCRDCRGYKNRPMQYVTSEIGSRNDSSTFYYGETENGMSLQVVCGYFRGDLEGFEKAVLTTYANDEEYKTSYLKEIEKVKVLFELEENYESK